MLRATEDRVTGPARGLSREQASRYFSTLLDLAEARLRGGDLAACLAAVDRALEIPPPKEARADFLELRARVLHREGRTREALEDLQAALPRAAHGRREDVQRVRGLVEEEAPRPGAAPAPTPGWTLIAPDRGEIRLEVEVVEGTGARRHRMTLADGRWIATIPSPASRVRYRFVADDHRPRVDPGASRIVLVNDKGWSVHEPGPGSGTPGD